MLSLLSVAIITSLGVLSVVYAYSAAAVSWNISKSDYFEPAQKAAQHLIVWAIPILGAALVLHILSHEQKWKRPGWIPLLDYLILSAFLSSVGAVHDPGANGIELHSGNDQTQGETGDD